MEGISPRYVQDKISNALVSDKGEGCVNPFMVLNELEAGLKTHSLISSEEVRKQYRELLTHAERIGIHIPIELRTQRQRRGQLEHVVVDLPQPLGRRVDLQTLPAGEQSRQMLGRTPVAERPLRLRRISKRHAGEFDAPTARGEQPGGRVQQSRFAAAIRT